MPVKKTAATIHRKVLQHDDFGLCVLLPKTEWAKLPSEGKAAVTVNGRKRTVTVRVEECNCRGVGRHEHRFLSLPHTTGAKVDERVAIGLA